MSSPFSVFTDILGALGRVTLYNSNPATAGLGYGLGGQGNMTAHSSLPAGAQPHNLSPEAQAALQAASQRAQYEAALNMAQAQAMAQAHFYGSSADLGLATGAPITAYSTGTITFVSTGNARTHTQGFTFASAKSTEAVTRSMELLYDWLNPEQRKQLAVNGFFDVIGGDTGIRYRLYPPANYNVHQLVKDSNETEVKLCFEPKDKSLPKGDIWLTQKLALELDERATLEIANRSATYFG